MNFGALLYLNQISMSIKPKKYVTNWKQNSEDYKRKCWYLNTSFSCVAVDYRERPVPLLDISIDWCRIWTLAGKSRQKL